MATTLPTPSSRSHSGPLTSTLPCLSVSKTRPSTRGAATAGTSASPPSTPQTGLRAPSKRIPAPTSALPTPKGVGAAGAKTLRKAVSINSFPQPPRNDSRIGSLPQSPRSGSAMRISRTPTGTKRAIQTSSGNPSLLNGSGDGRSVQGSRVGARSSDGLVSTVSDPQSRSSSAEDTYSTSATTFDDLDMSPGSQAERRDSKGEGKGNVLVSVRVRPDAGVREQGRVDGEWMVDGRKSLVSYRGKEGGEYIYDNVFATHDDNSRVYDHCAKRLVRRVMEGYHGTVFAYGMTGTGKTFSMQGTASSPGVIPLAITDIFSYIRETPSREFLLRVSYLEIYNEKIHDLLNMSTGNGVGSAGAQEEIKLREDSKRGIYASPLREEIVQSPTQLLRVIARGDQARRTASTQFNSRSSRSHAVVQIVVESRERIPGSGCGDKRSALVPGGVRVSTLSLIDLAGSEKAAESKDRRIEGSHINKSLLTLGTVISKLSEAKDGKAADKDIKHLPYRDSKLTRLLQGALSGNSLVSILCTIQIGPANSAATANSHTAETLNTLKFASRAKNSIISHAKRAEEALGAGGDGAARVLLERYRMEIQELRSQLESKTKTDGVQADDEVAVKDEEEDSMRRKEAERRHEEQMLEMQLARTALKERIDHLNKLILDSRSIGVNSSGSYSSLGLHNRHSQLSTVSSYRTSIAASISNRSLLDRSASVTSSSSTIGRNPSVERHSASLAGEARGTSGEVSVPVDEDESMGEYADGFATLAAQNQFLRTDLADKNRYIATLEKRLIHARRTSSSRTSAGYSPHKGIMVGEDHSIASLMKDKDMEIADLRAKLEEKDRLLAALRNGTRSRDSPDANNMAKAKAANSREARSSLLHEQAASSPPTGALPDPPTPQARRSGARASMQSVDEMSKILDEMIQDKVESGQIVRGDRGSVRIANDQPQPLPHSPPASLRLRSPLASESKQLALEA